MKDFGFGIGDTGYGMKDFGYGIRDISIIQYPTSNIQHPTSNILKLSTIVHNSCANSVDTMRVKTLDILKSGCNFGHTKRAIKGRKKGEVL